MKAKLLLLFALITTLGYAQTYTYDWNSVSFNGTFYVRQTVAGVQAEVTNSSNTVEVLNGGGYAGSNGNIVASAGNVTSMSVSFSVPINIQTIFAFDGNSDSAANWTFTPTGGTNSTVVENIDATIGSAVNANWTHVTGFTITSSATVDRFAIDDIVFTVPTICTVNIPDANFKAYLLGKPAINTNGDTEIQCTEASAFTGIMGPTSLNISDLTGIEAFTQITHLFCGDNNLTNLDVSANTELILLNCVNNNLTGLGTSANTALIQLLCGQNNLTGLDVSTNTNLYRLDFTTNNLTNIDISTNVNLGALICSDNNLISIDTSTNVNLDEVYSNDNNITNLDLSTNTLLTSLNCQNNSLQSLDVSANTSLGALFCNDNQLASLNIANGNNSGINFMHAQNNSTLSCIQIDAGFTSPNGNGWQKDATANFNMTCASLSVNDYSLNAVSIYPNPANSFLNIDMIQALKQVVIYSILGKEVLRTQNENIDVSSLSNGLFLVKTEDENGHISIRRFIKN